MFQIDRHKKIYDYLLENENATVNELANIFDVATMTIRRDLDKMETEGLIKRVFGGAVIDSNIVTEVKYIEKEQISKDEKASIAKYAASLVCENSVVILDAGTTCMEIAKNIVNKEKLTVVTTDILIAAYLMNFEHVQVYCTGGKIQSNVGCCIDNIALDFLNNINADVCFIGASAVSNDLSLSTYTMEKVKIKQAMIKSSDYKVLISDDSKFYKKSFAKICDLKEFDLVITNNQINDEVKLKFTENDIKFKLV